MNSIHFFEWNGRALPVNSIFSFPSFWSILLLYLFRSFTWIRSQLFDSSDLWMNRSMDTFYSSSFYFTFCLYKLTKNTERVLRFYGFFPAIQYKNETLIFNLISRKWKSKTAGRQKVSCQKVSCQKVSVHMDILWHFQNVTRYPQKCG